jgi:secreted trypsin-like serine protease
MGKAFAGGLASAFALSTVLMAGAAAAADAPASAPAASPAPSKPPPPPAPTRHGRIVGGVASPEGARPWQVSLEVNGFEAPKAHFCGGSFIADGWVLTAAHCMDPAVLKLGFHVLAGTNDLRTGGRVYTVDRIVVHQGYDAATHANDIALLHVNASAPTVENRTLAPAAVRPIRMATALDNRQSAVAETALVTGFGLTAEQGAASPVLMEVRIPVVTNEVCNAPGSYGGRITAGMLCAGQAGSDSCQGDSGGPLVEQAADRSYFQVGVVSFGEGCGREGKYGVYTRVSAYGDWIESVMKSS